MANNTQQANQKSATDLAEVTKIVNAKKGTKAWDEKESLLTTTSRAGAGGVIAGQVGLRPNGLKKANDLIDLFTPGKYQQPDRPFSKPIEEPKDASPNESAAAFKMRLVLPRNFCPDCDRTNRPSDPATAGGTLNFGMFPTDRPDLGLKAMEIFTSMFCQECTEKFRAQIDTGNSSLILMSQATKRELLTKWMETRQKRVQENTENFIRAQRLANNDALWINNE